MTKRFSIRKYLTRHIVLWSFLMTSIPAALIYVDTLHEVDELFDASLVQTAKVLNGLISRKAVEQNKQHLIDSLLAKDVDLVVDNQHHHYEKKIYFQIWDGEELIVKSQNAPAKRLAHLNEGFHKITADGYDWLSFAIYSKHDKWWLVVGERHDIREEIALKIVVDHVLPLVVFIPLLILIIGVVLKRGFSPLEKIRQEIRSREYKQLDPIENDKTPLETAELVDNLNELLMRLKQAYQRESNFVSDVAHELRTPLSGLLLNTEIMIDDSSDAALTADFITMKKSIMRLTHLVNQLLSSARSSREIDAQTFKVINLRSVILDVLADHADQADIKQITLNTAIESIDINGDQGLLEVLLRNVIDNAIRYSPEGGELRVSCNVEANNQINLVIEDSGPGIPEDLYDDVKTRFFRVNPKQSEGSGLGLAIVSNVVEQLAIEWVLDQSELGGLKHVFIFEETA